MKFIKSPQKTLIIFLTSIIIVGFFFIVRLEIKAANLQTQWEKHQESLKNNKDILQHLESFYRSVGMNTIKFDKSDFMVVCSSLHSHSRVDIDSKSISITTKGTIEIEASGDIDITSKNGNVNIKGKKVNLNE
ncbi:MAG: hypothetical protein WBG58_01110 [Ignavibacteriaceae bacterium]